MDESAFNVYIARARQMANAMRLVRDDREYLAAAALLAVHCAIAFNDAVLVKLNGTALHSQDHRQAADVTRRRCMERKLSHEGLKQYRELLSNKSKISYGDQVITPIEVQRYCAAAERFESWAERILRGY
jgi:hypothetical protein